MADPTPALDSNVQILKDALKSSGGIADVVPDPEHQGYKILLNAEGAAWAKTLVISNETADDFNRTIELATHTKKPEDTPTLDLEHEGSQYYLRITANDVQQFNQQVMLTDDNGKPVQKNLIAATYDAISDYAKDSAPKIDSMTPSMNQMENSVRDQQAKGGSGQTASLDDLSRHFANGEVDAMRAAVGNYQSTGPVNTQAAQTSAGRGRFS